MGMTFLISARSNGDRTWLRKGDALSVEWEDGKGVGGRIADVIVQDGGSRLLIEVTHDGEPRPIDPPKRTTQYRPGPAAGSSEMRFTDEGISVHTAGGWSGFFTPDEAVEMGLLVRVEGEDGEAPDAGSQDVCDEAGERDWVSDAGDSIEELTAELRRTRIEVELARERTHELAIREARARQAAQEAEQARDYWRRKAHSRLLGPDTIVVNITNPRTGS